MISWTLAALLAVPASAGHGLAEMERGRDIGVRFLGCELLASGRILAEASSRLQLVDSEASYLLNETQALAETWRREGGADVNKRLADREVWRAVEARQELDAARVRGAQAVESAEKRRKAFKKALDRDLARGGDGQAAGGEADKALAAARSAASEVSRAASSLRAAQDILDGALALTGAPLRPWHHNYRDNGLPRPEYGLEFARLWESEMERAHHELHTGWKR